ncbi:MAG TPA: cation:proton antiporter [Gemmatimonadales bacterium]|nr:cation:proton antiporter [Gemmatimonadales bacterium]
MPVHNFLRDLAIVLVTAAITALTCQRLKLPVVLGYLLAGFLVGPRTPPRLIADEASIQTLSELGVVLLMFSIGLEFRVRQVVALAPTAGLTAAVEVSGMLVLGYAVGHILGWTSLASLFAAGVVASSSTMIIVKTFEEEPPAREFKEFLFGVLIFEDLAAVLLLTILTSVASTGALTISLVGRVLAGLALALLVMLAAGMLVVPRAVRAAAQHWRPETMVLVGVGFCFGMAAVARAFGYSVALGAFLAGCLVAESGAGRQIEREIRPVRDMFAAIFFVAVGMQFDLVGIRDHWPLVLLFLLIVTMGKLTAVSVGSFLTGRGVRTAVRTGMSMAQIGEFSFIISAVGLQLGAVPSEVYAVAITVSAITAFTTPWTVRYAPALAGYVDRKLPHPLQSFASLYGTWVEALRRSPARGSRPAVGRLLWLLLLDALAVLAIVLGYPIVHRRLINLIGTVSVSAGVARLVLILVTLVLLAPFVFGIVAVARRLGLGLAAAALPPPGRGKVDNAFAPRRLMGLTMQIAVVLLVGAPLVAITQPFLPPFGGILVLAGVLALLGIGFYRSASELQGHLKAGAEVVVAALAKQSAADSSVDLARRLLPGLGDFTAAQVGEGSEADDRTLTELNLRGRTGATILGLLRGHRRIPFPDAGERLQAGDLVALTGSHEAIAAAKALLTSSRGADHT